MVPHQHDFVTVLIPSEARRESAAESLSRVCLCRNKTKIDNAPFEVAWVKKHSAFVRTRQEKT